MYLLKEQLQIVTVRNMEWKIVTLRNIVKRAKTAVCTTTHQKRY